MPNKDGTGPNGKGTATGLGKGECRNENIERGNRRRNGMRNRRKMNNGIGKRMGVGRNNGKFEMNGGTLNSMTLDEQEKFLESKLKEIRKAKQEEFL